MNFIEKLNSIIEKNDSLLCVGLDIDIDKIPRIILDKSSNPHFDFNKRIIDETKDIVCAYKLNMAFYESLGIEGYQILKKTVDYIPKNIVIILDGKRNDIGNTARMYAKSIYQILKADSTTLNPYLGIDGIKPFLEYKDRCSFVLCRTSNQSAKDFQDLIISNSPLYQIVALKIKQWNINENLGAVVGATYPDELKIVRKILGENIPILIPGVGKQGGDIKKTIKNGTNSDGKMALVNSSRSIIYAGKNEDFADKSREIAIKTRDLINKYR
jgi:orotidine 5'-phosphate decarboxylase subfamily 2